MKSKLWKVPLAGYVIFFLIGAVVGIQWHRLYLFPFPQIHEWRESQKVPVPLSKKIVITKYTAKTPVFLDRLYFDSIGDKRLEGLLLVQITRHHKDIIKIQAHTPVTIYRFITNKNINTQFDSWSTSEIPIHVRGNTCTHTRVVKKDFPAGIISLRPGGPVASSPILIKVHGYTEIPLGFEVLD
jgi:hypothetical protein